MTTVARESKNPSRPQPEDQVAIRRLERIVSVLAEMARRKRAARRAA